MINVEMTKANGVTLATKNTICNENVNVTIANGENLIAENIKKDVQIADVVGTFEGGGDDTALIGLIQRDMTEFVIPNSVTSIGNGAFRDCYNLTSVTIPDSVTRIGFGAFQKTSLVNVLLPKSITTLGYFMVANDSRVFASDTLTSVIFETPNSNDCYFGYGVFKDCKNLKEVKNLPNGTYGSAIFENDKNLELVTLIDGFNSNNLNLSASTLYTAETIVSWLNALADRTGQSTYTLTIGSTNLAKLTEEQIAIATNKNWTLA